MRNWNIGLRLTGIFILCFSAGFMCMTAERRGPTAADFRQPARLSQPRADRQRPANRIDKTPKRTPDRAKSIRPTIRFARFTPSSLARGPG